MYSGELRFSLNGVDMGLAEKNDSLKQGSFYITMFVYKSNFEMEILNPPFNQEHQQGETLLHAFKHLKISDENFISLYCKS